MSIKIEASILAGALKGAAGIVQSRNTIAVLSAVRLVAENDGRMEVMTTNLDVEYRQTIAVEGDGTINCCIDAKRLLQMAMAAKPGALLDITSDGGIVTIKSGRSRWAAPSMSSDDFPVMPAKQLFDVVTFDAPKMASHIARTAWTCSTEAARYYMGGIFINMENGNARFTATDGNCLAMIDSDVEWPGTAPDIIAPRDFMEAIKNACADGGGVSLEWDAKKIRATIGDIVITGKTIDATYPDYRRIFPAPCEPIAVDGEEMAGAIKRVRIASDAKQRKLRVKRSDGAIDIMIEGTSGFEGNDIVQSDCVEDFETGVNADFLTSMLAACGSDTVTIEQSDASAVMVFRPATQDGFCGLVMPMRI